MADPARDLAEPRLYRRFVIAAVLCTMTLGASFGAYNLLWMHWALGPLPPAHNAFHASFQVTGFVLLFVMGFAYQLAPRFLARPLALPGVARATFVLALGGLLLRGYGQFGRLLPATAPALFAGACLQLAGIAGFAAVLARTWGGARPRPAFAPFQVGLAAGLSGWLAADALLVAGGVAALKAGDAEAAVRWNEPFYLAALLGGTLPFIQGVTLRAGSAFLGVREPRARPAIAAIALGLVGAALTVIGRALGGGHRGALELVAWGLLVSAASVALFLAATGVLARRVRRSPIAASATTRGARAAFVSMAAYAALAALYGAMELAGRAPPSALYDGARHALGLGCITVLIFSMASRMLPAFERSVARWSSCTAVGLALIVAGLVARELQVAAFLLRQPALLRVSGLSGIVAAAGVCLCGAAILATLRARPARRRLPIVGTPADALARAPAASGA
jgi:hypothetical protein